MSYSFRQICVVLVALCAGCASPKVREAASPPSAPEAIIGRHGARFVFRPDTVDHMAWPGSPAHAYDGLPLRSWDVYWHRWMPYERLGLDPSGLTFVLRWRPGPTRDVPLSELLVGRRPEVATSCLTCEPPAVIPRLDRNVTLALVGRSVVFLVRGDSTIRRLFPVLPDSVTFDRRTRGGSEQTITIPVQHREP